MISYLVPDIPSTESRGPYIKEIENNRWHSNFDPLYFELRQHFADKLLNGTDSNTAQHVSCDRRVFPYKSTEMAVLQQQDCA